MAKRMNIEDCKDKGYLIETGDKDIDRAKELVKLAKHRLDFWKKTEQYANEFPSLFIEGHYEIVKELITSILYLDGWKATNHECLFSYIMNHYKNNIELDYEFLLELKDARNSIDYRGVMLSKEIWIKNKIKIIISINALINHIEEMF